LGIRAATEADAGRDRHVGLHTYALDFANTGRDQSGDGDLDQILVVNSRTGEPPRNAPLLLP